MALCCNGGGGANKHTVTEHKHSDRVDWRAASGEMEGLARETYLSFARPRASIRGEACKAAGSDSTFCLGCVSRQARSRLVLATRCGAWTFTHSSFT